MRQLLLSTLLSASLCLHAQVDCLMNAEILTTTESWGNEVSWTLFSLDGTPVAYSDSFQSSGSYVQSFCLEDSCYVLQMEDSFGDGWNGAEITISYPDFGLMYGPFTMLFGSYESVSFGFSGCESNTLGCTDPEAPNYDPEATVDDGTCLPPCVCPDVYEPVCGYDSFTGETLTFNNLCELECAYGVLLWDGDCADEPIWGCTEPEAFNYDENATDDNGNYCLYIPECGDDYLVALNGTPNPQDSLSFFGLDGFFAGLYGPVSTFEQAWLSDGSYIAYGCMETGCYNFHVFGQIAGGSIDVSVNEGTPETFTLNENEFQGVFAFGLGVDDCEFFISGCTDPQALNYSPSATEDDGSCIYPFSCPDSLLPAEMYVCTFNGGDEVALTITDSQGYVIYDQQGYPDLTIDYIDLCLDPEECYTATMSNIAGGDSWNGGYFWINAAGGEWANGALDGASSEDVQFGTGEDCEEDNNGDNGFIAGCTDPSALNYNVEATIDDGSCTYDAQDSLNCDGLTEVFGLFFQGDPFISEVSWAVIDSTGSVVLAGDGTNTDNTGEVTGSQTCLEDGCYTVELYDSWGDGWGGGLLVLTAGNDALTFTLENSGFAAFPFGVNTECQDEGQETPDGTTNPGMSGWDEAVTLTPYPTPTEDIVNVLGSGFDNESPIVVRVRDGIGRIVKDRVIQPNSTSQDWVFDVRSWPSGIYTVEGTQGKKHTSTRFLVAH